MSTQNISLRNFRAGNQQKIFPPVRSSSSMAFLGRYRLKLKLFLKLMGLNRGHMKRRILKDF